MDSLLTVFYIENTMYFMNIKPKRKRKTERNLTIKKMRRGGKTMIEIADFFGITRQRVAQILQK